MKKIIKHNIVLRKAGKLYYVDKHGNLCETDANRKGSKKGRRYIKKNRK